MVIFGMAISSEFGGDSSSRRDVGMGETVLSCPMATPSYSKFTVIVRAEPEKNRSAEFRRVMRPLRRTGSVEAASCRSSKSGTPFSYHLRKINSALPALCTSYFRLPSPRLNACIPAPFRAHTPTDDHKLFLHPASKSKRKCTVGSISDSWNGCGRRNQEPSRRGFSGTFSEHLVGDYNSQRSSEALHPCRLPILSPQGL